MCKSAAFATAAAGGRVAWVVPQYKNGRSVWRDAENILADLRKLGLVEINRADRTATFANGGFFGIYSADNIDSIRSEAFHLVIVDEASRISLEAWTDAIMPTLADYDGQAILPSTPKGQNWFYTEFLRGRSLMNAEQASFTAPSAANPSPAIRKAAAAAKHRVSDRTYRQEWLAEFIPDAGEVFRNVDVLCILKTPKEPPRDHVIVAGLDWGQDPDYTVLSIWDATTRQQLALYRFNAMDWTPQRERILKYCLQWRVQYLHPEINSMGGPNIEELEKEFAKAGVRCTIDPFTTTAGSKTEAVDAFALAMEQRGCLLLDDEDQRNELKAFARAKTRAGNTVFGAPSGMHDDIVMSNLFAWNGIINYRPHGGIFV